MVAELDVFNLIAGYILPRKGGPVGNESLLLTDDNGDKHEFSFETFNFSHECLTLAVHLRKYPALMAV